MNPNKGMPNNAKIFTCESCDFKCYKKSNYDIHLITRKHLNLINPNFLNSKNAAKIFECKVCNKIYKPIGNNNYRKLCNKCFK